jgi:hypothetical protein
MTCKRLAPRKSAIRSSAVVVALSGILACQSLGQVKDSSQGVAIIKAPALPQGCKMNNPPRSATELNACLDSLDFDTIEAVGDKQPLMINPPCPASCKYGPLATIQPEKHSHRYSEDELKEGRIIAKLFLDPAATKDYKKLGLIRGGTTYWWVQKTSDKYDDWGRSVYVTLDKDGKLRPNVEHRLSYTEHENGFQQAVARWVWDPNDEKTQGTCGQGCCH